MGIGFSSISLFYSIMLTVVFFYKKRLQLLENKKYSQLIVINLIGLVLAILCYYTVMYNEIIPITNFIISRLYLVYLAFWITTFTQYIYIISYHSQNKRKFLKLHKESSNILYILAILVTILSFILPLDYYSKNGVVYSFGPAANLAFIYGFILEIFCVIFMLRNRKEITQKKYIPLFIYMVGGTIVMIVQKYNPGLLLMTSTETFVTFLMYFTIENPDMKLIEQLNIARDQAEKANSAKTDFLSSMSHEIRTPLNAIVGFSNSLNENEKLPEELKGDVKDILIASDNLLEIVNGVLDISKIEANKIEIINKEYDTKKIFDELTKLTKARIVDKPIELITKFDESIPRVLYGDHTRVKQVILNILTNAAKYTDKGKIIFTTESVIKDGICRMIVSVEDTGRGIKKENIDKLFTKFERLEEDRNTTIEGTGLGLAITKKLLELMHGKIVVQSEYGKGSKFTITIDQRIVKNPTITIDENINNVKITDLSGKRVLVVDDNKLNIKVATRLLTPYNLTITSCESGFEAVDKLKENSDYDLILMDDMMPKMSGTETLKKIKEENLFDGPIIALTANALTGMKEKYISEGFNDYLAKPIEKAELNRVLEKYLK